MKETKAPTHQISQNDFDGHEMARGVQQDASVCEPGEVADDGRVDAFLQHRRTQCNPKYMQFDTGWRSQLVSYGSVLIFIHQLTEGFQT